MQNKLELFLKRGPTEYRGLETHLQAMLKPVSPRPEFVGDLRRKLSDRTLPPELAAEMQNGQVLLIIAVSLLSIVLVVVMSVRAIALLASALGMIQQIQRREQGKSRSIQTPARLTRSQA